MGAGCVKCCSRKTNVVESITTINERAAPGSHLGPSVPPRSPQSKDLSQLEGFDWYAGKLDKSGAEDKLHDKLNGTFLVRTGNVEGQYTLSLQFLSEVKHIEISKTEKNMYSITGSKDFSTISQLVTFYEKNMLGSWFPGLETKLNFPYRSIQEKNPPPNAIRPFQKQADGVSGIVCSGRVMYNLDPLCPQELGLKVGQVVSIIDKPDELNGWWKGEYQEKRGYFPSKYVEENKILMPFNEPYNPPMNRQFPTEIVQQLKEVQK